MHHLISIVSNPIFWIVFLVFLNYHHFPKGSWSWLGMIFKVIAWPINKLDQYIFDDPDEIKEIKKSKFKKIVSPFGEVLLAVFAIIFYGGDYLFIQPASRIVNKILESEKMARFIKFVENRDIIWLRIFVGIPFFAMEITGIIAGVFFLTNPLFGLIIYLSKFAWVIPFKFIDKVGHDKLSQDPWYSGLKQTAVKGIDWLFNLRFMKKMHNFYVRVKNFFKGSEHSAILEIKVRKKVIAKAIKEIMSLKHLSTEFSESTDIDVIFFTPEATKKLENLKESPNNPKLKKWIMDYIKDEIGVKDEKPKTKV
jgi:hypothetical protein